MQISKPGLCGLVLTPALLLAACGEEPSVSPDPIAEPGAEIVECAIGVGSEYAAQCPVERTVVDDSEVLVVNHPGGGFRRFTLASDGSGLTAFDGADEAMRSLDGNVLEISVGTDRYRFPARPMNDAPEAAPETDTEGSLDAESSEETGDTPDAAGEPTDNAGS